MKLQENKLNLPLDFFLVREFIFIKEKWVNKDFEKKYNFVKSLKLLINISDIKEENARMRTATQHTIYD